MVSLFKRGPNSWFSRGPEPRVDGVRVCTCVPGGEQRVAVEGVERGKGCEGSGGDSEGAAGAGGRGERVEGR